MNVSTVYRGLSIATAVLSLAQPLRAQIEAGADSSVTLLDAGPLRTQWFLMGRPFDSYPMLPTPLPYNPGTRTLAFGETLLGNFVPWLFNEYGTRFKDITRISPTTWKNNIVAGPQWDDNHFHVNMLMHPYHGSVYYAAGRSNGYNFEKSSLFTVFGSTLWECCGESHRPSLSDFVTTTLGGVAFGEMLHRWTNQLLNRANGPPPKPPNGWWEVPSAVLSPTRTLTRWTLGRFSSTNPTYETPLSWSLFTSTGYDLTADNVVQEFGYTYGDVIVVSTRSRPFTHFESVVELDFGNAKQTIGRVQARGSLWSRRFFSVIGACKFQEAVEDAAQSAGLPGIPGVSNCNAQYFHIVPFLGFDYINNNAYEFGGQTAGLATFLTVGQYPLGTHGIIAVNGHGFFGGVQSEHADIALPHDGRSERPREYDFAFGPGYGGALIFSHQALRVSAFYRKNRLKVLDGSNFNGFPANHRTRLVGVTGRVKLVGRFGVGADYRQYRRRSQFDDPSLSPSAVTQEDHRFGIFLTIDVLRPLGLFVF